MNHDHHEVLILHENNQYVDKHDFVNRYRLINQPFKFKGKFHYGIKNENKYLID
jgi:hypothetical protein